MSQDFDFIRRLDAIERNVSDQAKSITALIGQLNDVRKTLEGLQVDREVRRERDRNIHERFDRLEKEFTRRFGRLEEEVTQRFGNISKPMWAAVLAFISALVATLVSWIAPGGGGMK